MTDGTRQPAQDRAVPPRGEAARRFGPALDKAYQFLVWLVPTVEKFPRSQRFLLGDRIQTMALDGLAP